jgi:hypothetical protein
LRSTPSMRHERIVFGVEGRTLGDAMSITRMPADPFLAERSASARTGSR